jgi:hypothetical protein
MPSAGSWSEDGTELTFKLRQGVKWHDGKPFTAADVKCTYDLLLGKAKEKLRINPRKVWFRNLEQVTAKQTSRSGSSAIRITGSRAGPIWTGSSCLYITRLLKTPIIGTTVEYVASSMIDMLAGLSW